MIKSENSSSILVENKKSPINSEDLAYWYFRLNGFLTIQNFVVHPNSGSAQKTEVDIIAARFPYRKELPENKTPMQDDECLVLQSEKIRIILAEIKVGRCKLNPSWTNADKKICNRYFQH